MGGAEETGFWRMEAEADHQVKAIRAIRRMEGAEESGFWRMDVELQTNLILHPPSPGANITTAKFDNC